MKNKEDVQIMKYFLLAMLSIGFILSGCVQVTQDGKPIKATPSNKSVHLELNKALTSFKGEYAQLKYEETNKIISEIFQGNIDTIKSVLEEPNKYEPPVLFAYADQVFLAGQPEVAMFWYYTAQLRARSDANKSLDSSVREGVTNLSNKYGNAIGQYALANLDKLQNVMVKVIEWDESSTREYDPKWVAILGQEAKFSNKIRFRSESEYKKINDSVREGWKLGFKNAIYQLRKEQAERMLEE